MMSCISLRRSTCRAIWQQRKPTAISRRGLAAPASGSFQYQIGTTQSGVRFATRELAGPTASLALVARAGPRHQPFPGGSEGLEKFAFRSTQRRSTLRIIRECELFGAEIHAYRSRENLILSAKFLRQDLPYFVELFNEVSTQSKYQPHVFLEEVVPQVNLSRKLFLSSTKAMAIESAHGLAFHTGLGTSLYSASTDLFTKYVDAARIENLASIAYSVPNISIAANGVDHSELSRWIDEFYNNSSKASQTDTGLLESPPSKYYGGEERISHGSGNTMVLAFPGSSSYTGKAYKPEIAVLAALLGGKSTIKWSPGFSLLSKAATEYPGVSIDTKSAIYSDAGLLYTVIDGPAEAVSNMAKTLVSTIRDIASGNTSREDYQKAVAHARFVELEFGSNIQAGLELTGSGLISSNSAYQLDETAKAIGNVTKDQVARSAKELLNSKATVSTVGDLFVLPYAADLGLNL